MSYTILNWFIMFYITVTNFAPLILLSFKQLILLSLLLLSLPYYCLLHHHYHHLHHHYYAIITIIVVSTIITIFVVFAILLLLPPLLLSPPVLPSLLPLNNQISRFLFFYQIISGKEDNYSGFIQIIVGL